jgi:hypothetical protein
MSAIDILVQRPFRDVTPSAAGQMGALYHQERRVSVQGVVFEEFGVRGARCFFWRERRKEVNFWTIESAT